MENKLKKQVRIKVIRSNKNIILLVLIGMILISMIIELIYFLKLDYETSVLITIALLVFYIMILLIFSQRKRIIKKTSIIKKAPTTLNEKDIKEAIKEAIQETSESRPKIKIQKPKYIASTEGKTYHKISCRLAKLIKRKYRLTNDSEEFFKRQKYNPCNICMK